MLESVLADVLTRVLGQYLQGIDRESVRFGAWSGLVDLRGVALRPEALAVLFETLGMALPVTVEAGFIGLLRLEVPWNAIGTTPVQIHMEDITIMARPVRGDGSDDSELELRDKRIKRAKLNTDDAVREASWDVASEAGTSYSRWASWLITDQLRAKIIDNIQIHLKGIILRFEDPFSDPRHPYVASVVCDSLKAVSVNQLWQQAFVDREGQNVTRKLLEVKGFRINWAPITPKRSPGLSGGTLNGLPDSSTRFETAELLEKFVKEDGVLSLGAHSASEVKNILHSVDGSLRMCLSSSDVSVPSSKELRDQSPAIDLDIRFPNVVIDLDDVQYACILQTSVYFARVSTRGFRPTAPKDRWLWAIDQLLPGFSVRRIRALRFSEEGLIETRERRLLYFANRKALLKARRTNAEEPTHIVIQLEEIEDSISFEELLAYRDVVDRQMEKEGVQWRLAKPPSSDDQQRYSEGTTTNSFWKMLGFAESEKAKRENVDDENFPCMPSSSIVEEVHERRNMVAQDSKPSLALRVSFLLQGATINLFEHGFPSISIPRVSLNLKNLRIGVLYSSAQDLVAEAVLGSIEARDLRNNTMMVYSRLASTDYLIHQNSFPDIESSYPMDVLDAIESIRSGSNPAKDLLLDDSTYTDDLGHAHYTEDEFEVDTSGSVHSSSPRRQRYRSWSTNDARGSSPPSSYRVTESEFLGNPKDHPGAQKYIAAFQYVDISSTVDSEYSERRKSTLDVSIATLEAIVDGPQGPFVWGLKFWQPKGMAQDPIMAFLGAAAGARIAELRMEIEEALLANNVPMQINAVILAPRFIIPSRTVTGPALVVNMGTLGLCTSDNSLKFQESTPTKKNVRYSNYVLTLDDLGMYFSPNLTNAVSRKLEAVSKPSNPLEQRSLDTINVERIIRPFSLRVILQTLRDSNVVQVAHAPLEGSPIQESSIAKVRVRGNIPGLSLILSQTAFQHLVVTAQGWGEEFQATERERSLRQSQTTTKDGIWNEKCVGTENSILSMPSERIGLFSSPPENSLSQMAPQPTALASYDVKVNLQKVSIELRDSADLRLVTAVASQMLASVVKKGRKTLQAEFSLRSWSITDGSRGSTAAFRRLVYAGTFNGGKGVSPPRSVSPETEGVLDDEKNFVSVQYILHLATQEQTLRFRFLSLNMVFVRETYTRMAYFLHCVRRHAKKHRLERKREPATCEAVPEENSLEVSSESSTLCQPKLMHVHSVSSSCSKMTIIAEFDGVNLQLVASGGAIAIVEMKDCKIHYLRDESYSKRAWGGFRYFSIRDLTAPIEEHVQVVTYEALDPVVDESPVLDEETKELDKLLTDEWILTIPEGKSNVYKLVASFRGLKICFLYRFLEVLQQYASVFMKDVQPVLEGMMENSSGTSKEDISSMLRISSNDSLILQVLFDIELHDLRVRVPRHSSCSTEALCMNVSHIRSVNVYGDRDGVELCISFEGVQLATEYVILSKDDSNDASMTSTFLTDFGAQLSLEWDDSQHKVDGKRLLCQVAKFHISDALNICFSEAQYSVLYFVLTENFAETITGAEVSSSIDSLPMRSEGIYPSSSDVTDTLVENQDYAFVSHQIGSSSLGSQDIRRETLIIEVSVSFLSLELSRGWDVRQELCKIIGVYIENISISLKFSLPTRKSVEVSGNIVSVADLRKEAHSCERNIIVPLLKVEKEVQLKGTRYVPKENISITYEKEGFNRPSIVVFLSSLQLQVSISLLRDLTYMAIPGWPFLKSSAFAPDFEYIGRTVIIVLSESQVLLLSKDFEEDRRALAITGEFQLKIDWMRVTAAKQMSMNSKQLEVFAVSSIPSFIVGSKVFTTVCFSAARLKRTGAPLVYPTNSIIEYFGPDVDEDGRRLEISAVAVLCQISAMEIPFLKSVLAGACKVDASHIFLRDWIQPDSADPVNNIEDCQRDLKDEQKRLARDRLNICLSVPAARFVVTDDHDGLFVPVLEMRMTSISFKAHGSSMLQLDGEMSMDLFNPEKGWWEPALEPWKVSSSMSHGQSGTRAFVIKSEERLNVNISPTTVTAAMTVARTLRNATGKAEPNQNIPSSTKQKFGVQENARRPSVAAFLVRNKLGIPIFISLPSSSRRTTVAHGGELEVGAQSESLMSPAFSGGAPSRERALCCSISIPSYFSQELSASEIGKHCLTFFPTNLAQSSEDMDHTQQGLAKPLNVVWEVEMSNGVPVCTMRSLFRVINNTRSALHVQMVRSMANSMEDNVEKDEKFSLLKPQEYFPLPIDETESVVLVRPSLSDTIEAPPPFQWSSPVPSLHWLTKVAEENIQRERSEGFGSSSREMRFKAAQQILICHAQQDGIYDYFFKVVPVVCANVESRSPSLPSWLDISIRAPIILNNKLPGILSYRISRKDIFSSTFSGQNPEDGVVLTAGFIQPLDEAHLHFSGDSLDSSYLSLSYDNGPSPEVKTQPSSQFGPYVNLGAVEAKRTRSIHVSRVLYDGVTKNMGKDFRATLEPRKGMISRFQISAGVWVRNRSDTALEVCSRGSYYDTGSLAFRLRERPPLEQPDDYVCFEGPYLALRLPDGTPYESSPDHSNWWTTPSTLEDVDKPIVIGLPGRSLELEVTSLSGHNCKTSLVTIRNSSWIINNTGSPLQWCQQCWLDAHGNCPTRMVNVLSPGQAQGIHWEAKSLLKAVNLRLAHESGQSDWIWSPPIPQDIGFSRELPAKMYRPKSQEQYIARVRSKGIAGDSKALVVHAEDRQNPPYRIVNLCLERAISFSQFGSRERPWLVRAGKSTRYSWDDPLASPNQRVLAVRILETEELLQDGSSSSTGSSSEKKASVTKHPMCNMNIDVVGDPVKILSESYHPSVIITVSVDGATKIVTFRDKDVNEGTMAKTKKLVNQEPMEESSVNPVLVVGWDDIDQRAVQPVNCENLAISPIPCDYPINSEKLKLQETTTASNVRTDAAIFLDSIGISVVDANPSELVYALLRDIFFNYESFEDTESFSLQLQGFQIDNQLHKTPYPVLLWISPVDLDRSNVRMTQNEASRNNSPAIYVEVHRTITDDDILMIKSFKSMVRTANISFEDTLISRILRFLSDTALLGDSLKKSKLRIVDDDLWRFKSLMSVVTEHVNKSNREKAESKDVRSSSKRVYLHDFKISSSSLKLTSAGSGAAIAKAIGLDASARTLVALLLNVENCEFDVPALSVQHVFDSLDHFAVLVREYYVRQFSNQRMKLLASNSLMGNPAGLFDAVGTGARDFFKEPGRAKGSADFIASVGRGSKSLLAHTVGGIVDSVGGIPRAVSTGLEKAVGDNTYIAERQRIRASNTTGGHRGSASRNPAQGLATGALSFAHGISSGMTGLIREPVQGAKQGGAGGLLKGIGKAFIGGVAKPVAGALDLVAEPAASLSQQIGDLERARRSYVAVPTRPPRVFRGKNKRLECYDRRYAVGVCLYNTVQLVSGVAFSSDLLDWVELSDREDRTGNNSEAWVWSIVQKYSRSMPGAKKQLRKEERQLLRGQRREGYLELRCEKTRVALITEREIIVATLDCKLVSTIPLWDDAIYDIRSEGKEIVLKTSVPREACGSEEDGMNLLLGAQALLTAPWDASLVGRRRRPQAGGFVINRIACGSVQARDDLKQRLRAITESIGEKGKQKRYGLDREKDPRCSGQELMSVSNWRGENETEMRSADRKKGITEGVGEGVGRRFDWTEEG